jgi:hypothetical protein
MTKAIIITNESIETRTFDVGVTHSEIHEMVGGWFDCVRTDTLIGYVHDTGLIEGQDINFIATALFGRILCGTCVVFGAMNENGEYDGDDHDASPHDLQVIAYHAKTYEMWLDARASKHSTLDIG